MSSVGTHRPRRWQRWVWIAVQAMWACSSDATTGAVGGVITEPVDDGAHIYDPTALHTFDVEVAPADLARVDANPSAEVYVPARLHFEGQTYDVGYRYKGSVGAFSPPCTATRRGGGPKVGKCSVKLSFNWADPEARFFGLKKLQFHAMGQDPSMLRERLGYAMFREMGVPASRATHAILRVNGQADIYALVEQIDGRFTRSRFTEGGTGNLYKEIWPIHDDPAVYLAALETNQDEMPSVDRMLRFAQAVHAGPEAMARWLDLDITTSYMAVDRVIMNDDGAFHMYCVPGGYGRNPGPPGNHNYYWYEAAGADRMWLIPWDLDHSMRDSTVLPHIAVDWTTTPTEAQCSRMCAGALWGIDGPPPACDPVIGNFLAWLDRYDEKVDAFIAGPFRKPAVDDKLDRWSQQLRDAGYPPPPGTVEQLKAILDRARVARGFAY